MLLDGFVAGIEGGFEERHGGDACGWAVGLNAAFAERTEKRGKLRVDSLESTAGGRTSRVAVFS